MENLIKTEGSSNNGLTKEVTLPDSQVVIIREQNGNDDDIISQINSGESSTPVSKFLSGLIIEPKMSWQQVHKMVNANRYYLLLENRIFNHGPEMIFEHTFKDPQSGADLGTFEFEEDLSLYLKDFKSYYQSKLEKCTDEPSEEEKEKEKFEFQAVPHPCMGDLSRELSLSSGKIIKYNFANGESEEFIQKIGSANIRQNDNLRMRELKLKVSNSQAKDGWKTIDNFKDFTVSEMKEIRKDIKSMDPEFLFIFKLVHPEKPNIVEYRPVIAYQEFFFPAQ